MTNNANVNRPEKARGVYTAVVTGQSKFGKNHDILTVKFENSSAAVICRAKPGQFIEISCYDNSDPRSQTPLLRRPFSIAGIERISDQITQLQIIYRVIGPGTNWLSARRCGDRLNIIGPLGNGFDIGDGNNCRSILLGGGIGLPPMFFLADKLAQKGGQTVGFAAARSIDQIESALQTENPDNPLQPAGRLEQFNRSNTNCIIATDDGSYGYHGNIAAALEEFLDNNADWRGAVLYACGPDGMLKALAAVAEKRQMKCWVCMEAYMACGIGVCQSCVIQLNGNGKIKYKLVCADGPVFGANQVNWDAGEG